MNDEELDPLDPNIARAVPVADIDKVEYVINTAALPPGSTLQVSSGNPDANAKYVSVLVGPSPHS